MIGTPGDSSPCSVYPEGVVLSIEFERALLTFILFYSPHYVRSTWVHFTSPRRFAADRSARSRRSFIMESTLLVSCTPAKVAQLFPVAFL